MKKINKIDVSIDEAVKYINIEQNGLAFSKLIECIKLLQQENQNLNKRLLRLKTQVRVMNYKIKQDMDSNGDGGFEGFEGFEDEIYEFE